MLKNLHQDVSFKFSFDHKNCFLDLPSNDFSLSSRALDLRPIDTLMTNHERPLQCIAALSESIVTTGSMDHSIKIWDTVSRKCLSSLFGHKGPVTCLTKFVVGREALGQDFSGAFRNRSGKTSSDYGTLLVSGSTDKSVLVWNPDLTANQNQRPIALLTVKIQHFV